MFCTHNAKNGEQQLFSQLYTVLQVLTVPTQWTSIMPIQRSQLKQEKTVQISYKEILSAENITKKKEKRKRATEEEEIQRRFWEKNVQMNCSTKNKIPLPD